MLLCGIGAKPVAHLMQYHLLQWEVAKVKQLMTKRDIREINSIRYPRRDIK